MEKDEEYYRKYFQRKRDNALKRMKGRFYIERRVAYGLELIQNSLSNRSRCRECGELIGKNTLRGLIEVILPKLPKRYYNIKKYYCSECSLKLLIIQRKSINRNIALIRRIKRSRKQKYEDEKTLRVRDKMLKELEKQ